MAIAVANSGSASLYQQMSFSKTPTQMWIWCSTLMSCVRSAAFLVDSPFLVTHTRRAVHVWHLASCSVWWSYKLEGAHSQIDALAAEAKGIFDAKVDSAAAPVAGDFTPATSGGTASNAGVDDLVKELQDAGARLAAEVKAETQK